MNGRLNINFHQSNRPIRDFSTKFGGQPTWKSQAAWPLSRSTGEPMRFICQISLRDIVKNELPESVVYLFMTDSEPYGDRFSTVYDQYLPDGGENAAIIQPGPPPLVETVDLEKGPTLLAKSIKFPPEPVKNQEMEFAITLSEVAEGNSIQGRSGNKFNGIPAALDPREFPFHPKPSIFLMQLDMESAPFFLDLGDTGIGYLFISPSLTQARFLWR